MTRRDRRVLRALATACIASLVIAAVAMPALAQGKGQRRPQSIDRVLERHADRLEIDKATRKEIRALSLEGRKKVRAIREVMLEHRRELVELLAEDVPDRDAVFAKADEIGAAELALQKEQLRTTLDIRAILTPEQREELARIHEEVREGKVKGKDESDGGGDADTEAK